MNENKGDDFGLCPTCHKTDGCANVGKSHRFFCKEHKVSWFVGSNIFSSWRDQTEEEQRRIWDQIGLNDFENVVPYFYPRQVSGETTVAAPVQTGSAVQVCVAGDSGHV
jgi:hypothetical protein